MLLNPCTAVIRVRRKLWQVWKSKVTDLEFLYKSILIKYSRLKRWDFSMPLIFCCFKTFSIQITSLLAEYWALASTSHHVKMTTRTLQWQCWYNGRSQRPTSLWMTLCKWRGTTTLKKTKQAHTLNKHCFVFTCSNIHHKRNFLGKVLSRFQNVCVD